MSLSTPQVLPLPLLFLTLPQLGSRISSRPTPPLARADGTNTDMRSISQTDTATSE